jgi:hypothetical protein
MKGAHFTVSYELVLERVLDLAHCDITLVGDVLKVASDRAKDPRDGDALHVLPSRVVDGRGIRESMVGEVVAFQVERNLIAPAGIAWRRRIQNS